MSTDKEKELAQISLHKEIDLIQACITRMANNSFMVKGWLIAIITAVLAFGDKFTALKYLCFVLIFPVIALWYLDAFFLLTEKKYRKLYNWVIATRPSSLEHLYDLNPHRKDLETKDNIFSVMFSKTLWPFYLIPLLIFFKIILHDCDILSFFKECIK